jgi:predicted transcriptional regulator
VKQKCNTWDGCLLREWREYAGLTVKQASERTGINVVTWYRYEEGWRPPIENAHKIVNLTMGGIRYRDIFPGFQPEYA